MRLTMPSNWVGFEELWDELTRFHSLTSKVPNWPPYNIKKVGDNNFVIEMALAGFSKEDIEIIVEGDRLTIKGKQKPEENVIYHHKGIAERDFIRSFTLAESVVVKNASLKNGMLKINLERVIPEELRPKQIPVLDSDDLESLSSSNQQLLTEKV